MTKKKAAGALSRQYDEAFKQAAIRLWQSGETPRVQGHAGAGRTHLKGRLVAAGSGKTENVPVA